MICITDGYFGYEGKVILKGINLEVVRGKSLGILGKSGSGKTTILNTICKEIPLVSGNLKMNNKSLSVIFQKDGLFKWLTVRQNLEICLGDLNNQRVEEVCKELKIDDILDTYASKISVGQAQRVQIARMFLSNSDLVVLDEPTSSLDMVNKEQFIKLIQKYITTEQTVVLVSHDIEEVTMLSDEIIIIDKGRIKSKYENVENKFRKYTNNEFISLISSIRKGVLDEN